MEAACPSKSAGNSMPLVNNIDAKTNEAIGMLCSSNDQSKPLDIENNGEDGCSEQCSTSLQATNYLRGDENVNKAATKDGSFKEEISNFINEHKLVTADASSAPESVMVLNSMLLKKVIDKIDDLDKKLKSV